MYILVLLFVCLFFSGCATMLHGTRQTINVTSNPSGAIVTDGCTLWKTPAKIDLKRKHDYQLSIFKKGYKPQVIRLKRAMAGAIVANLILPGSVLWLGIDAANGAQWKLIPEAVTVKLKPEQKT